MTTTKNKIDIWWDNLTETQKRQYEYKVFGYPDGFEDPTLTHVDIEKIYNFINKKNINKI
jgi:hypothetical protein